MEKKEKNILTGFRCSFLQDYSLCEYSAARWEFFTL